MTKLVSIQIVNRGGVILNLTSNFIYNKISEKVNYNVQSS